jgi:type VI secretion system protein ImpK
MFVTEKFQQFHTELMRLQERLREGNFAYDADQPADARNAVLSASAAWRRIVSVLERQEQEAIRQGGDLGLELYKRAQYAMAALADEVFLNLAGEELFERIHDLLHNRDAGQNELARIYLSVLALGFQGRYRGRADAHAELEVIRRRLYHFIYGRDPRVVRGREALVPQAYMGTIERPRVELPYLKPWIWAIALLTLLWIGGQHLIWMNAVKEISPLVERILDPAVGTQPVRTTEARR